MKRERFKKFINLHNVSMSSTFNVAIAKRITDALSRFSNSSLRTGNVSLSSVNISVSRERRHLAASRDFSLRFSLFLIFNRSKEKIYLFDFQQINNMIEVIKFAFKYFA